MAGRHGQVTAGRHPGTLPRIFGGEKKPRCYLGGPHLLILEQGDTDMSDPSLYAASWAGPWTWDVDGDELLSSWSPTLTALSTREMCNGFGTLSSLVVEPGHMDM